MSGTAAAATENRNRGTERDGTEPAEPPRPGPGANTSGLLESARKELAGRDSPISRGPGWRKTIELRCYLTGSQPNSPETGDGTPNVRPLCERYYQHICCCYRRARAKRVIGGNKGSKAEELSCSRDLFRVSIRVHVRQLRFLPAALRRALSRATRRKSGSIGYCVVKWPV